MSLRAAIAAGSGAGIIGTGEGMEKVFGALVAGTGYLLNQNTKQAFARAVWQNKKLPEAAKRTLLRQLAFGAGDIGRIDSETEQ